MLPQYRSNKSSILVMSFSLPGSILLGLAHHLHESGVTQSSYFHAVVRRRVPKFYEFCICIIAYSDHFHYLVCMFEMYLMMQTCQ